MDVQLQRHSFTAAEYHRMAEAGIFGEDDRVELIAGEIVEMVQIGIRHASCVRRLIRLFSRGAGDRAVVDIQNPLRLEAHSEPQPDVVLLRPRADLYAASHPGPEDVLLLVEVAETSADVDREVKAPPYARAGIPEVWLVDLERDRIEIHRPPSPQGDRDVRTARRGQTLSPVALPGLELTVEAVLG
jgi:Uma2 family endonuclease